MKKFFGVILLCTTIFVNTACGTWNRQENPMWQYTDTAMGTVVWQILYANQQETAQEFSHRVMAGLDELEKQKISWRVESSELARLNASAGKGESFLVSPNLSDILTQCMEVSNKSDGAFDITIGNVTRLWNIDSWAAGEEEGIFSLPDQVLIEEILQKAGYEKLVEQILPTTALPETVTDRTTVQYPSDDELKQLALVLPQGMQLDLGAVGKGIALDYIHELLKGQNDIKAAVISAGGSILTYGSKPDKTPWKVGIVDPNHTSQNIAILAVEGGWYVATSGDYERFVEVDGVHYHHILDPVTGCPAKSGVRSVTILCRDGLLCDALSTACFVLGAEKGMELANEYHAEVLFVLDSGELVMSEDFPIVK